MSSSNSSSESDFSDENFPPEEGVPACQFKAHLEKLQEKTTSGETGLEAEFQVFI